MVVNNGQLIRYSLDMQVEPYLDRINTEDKIALLGSCFTEHIGKRLSDYYFDTFTNPNGIVFNPISLAEPISRLMHSKIYTMEDLVLYNNKWVSLFHHGLYSSYDPEACLAIMNGQLSAFENFISSAKWLVITFGTAWVYEYAVNNKIVANCHKMPQSQFNKRLLKVSEIVDRWQSAIHYLKKINNDLNIVFTVSPVRHLRDGVHENNLSKSTLLLAIEQLKGKNTHYFPAYELVVDDLRDYRFFEADAAHPSGNAISYVFDKFRQSVLSEESNEMLDAIDKFLKLKNHRQIDISEESTAVLNTKLETMKNDLITMVPRLKGLL